MNTTIFEAVAEAIVATREDAMRHPECPYLPIEKNDVKRESLFLEDLQMDDTEVIALLMNLEEQMGTDLGDPADELDSWRTVGDFADYVARYTEG